MIVEQVWTANAYRNFNYLIVCPDTGEALAVDLLLPWEISIQIKWPYPDGVTDRQRHYQNLHLTAKQSTTSETHAIPPIAASINPSAPAGQQT